MKALPPLPVLQAFEAAARLGNFTRAATERHLTASAVSRHIATLEHWCGEALFVRNGPAVSLTEAGRALHGRLAEPLQALFDTLSATGVATGVQPLYVFTLPSIAASLLLPHLGGFQAGHPHIRLSVATHYAMMSLPAGLPAVAVRFGQFDHSGLSVHRSAEEAMVAVASPGWCEAYGFDAAAWPAHQMLVHSDTPWPARIGSGRSAVRLPVAQGVEFNDAAVLLDAVCHGLGVAWLRQRLAERALAAGTLVAIPEVTAMSGRFYWLSYRSELADHPAVAAFRAWLLPHFG